MHVTFAGMSTTFQKQRSMEDKILQALAEVQRNTLLAAKQVLTIDDVALLTGLSKSRLYRMTCYKEIPHYKPNGKMLYFDRAEVEAWMKRGRVGTMEEAERVAVSKLARKEAGV